MSRTYVLQGTLKGFQYQRSSDISGSTKYPFSTFSTYDLTQIGYWYSGSAYRWFATTLSFDSSILAQIRPHTIESIVIELTFERALINAGYPDLQLGTKKYAANRADTNGDEIDFNTTYPEIVITGTTARKTITELGVPQYGYVLGQIAERISDDQKNLGNISSATLTIITAEEQISLGFNANGGSGAPATQTVWADGSYSFTIPSTTPTRTGYSFTGWNTKADGSGTAYAAGGTITISENTTLYAQWSALKSLLTEATNGETGGTSLFKWNAKGNFAHSIRVIFGNSAAIGIQVAAGTNQYEFSIPSGWNAELPNSESGVATVVLTTIADGQEIGTDSKQFTISVPASVVPSIGALTAAKVNENETVRAWNVYLQGYSQVTISAASAAGGSGASVARIDFEGAQLDQTNYNGELSATSGILKVFGDQEYIVTVTDSRGRQASKKITIYVTAYQKPTVLSLSALRCDSDGTVNPTTGKSLKATPVFTYTQVGTNAVTNSLSYKKTTEQNYTQVQTGITTGTTIIFAQESAEQDAAYNVQFVLSDSLGNTIYYTLTVPSVVGISFGLKNDRARFGGVVQQPGLEINWDTQIDGVLNVYNRQIGATRTGIGWYRAVRYSAATDAQVLGIVPFIIHIRIAGSGGGTDAHTVKLIAVNGSVIFTDEISKTYNVVVDKIRYQANGTTAYIDIHLAASASSSIQVDFDVDVWQGWKSRFTRMSLSLVDDAPANETTVAEYAFAQNGSVIDSLSFTNLDVLGTLHVSGKTTLDGDMSVAGSQTVGGNSTVTGNHTANNETVNGVLDVTQRRCYDTLSSVGWYRVCTTRDIAGTIIEFRIGRPYGANPAEAHRVSFYVVGGGKSSFVDETSISNTLGIDKIRCTYGGGVIHFDVHYSLSSGNEVLVYFDVRGKGEQNGTTVSNGLQAVADAPSGESTVAEHRFYVSNKPINVQETSSLLASGTIQATGDFYYEASEPCWVYLMFVMQANSSGSINIKVNNVDVVNWTSGEAIPVNFAFLPIPLMKGNTLYVVQSSNRASSYKIFAMR